MAQRLLRTRVSSQLGILVFEVQLTRSECFEVGLDEGASWESRFSVLRSDRQHQLSIPDHTISYHIIPSHTVSYHRIGKQKAKLTLSISVACSEANRFSTRSTETWVDSVLNPSIIAAAVKSIESITRCQLLRTHSRRKDAGGTDRIVTRTAPSILLDFLKPFHVD